MDKVKLLKLAKMLKLTKEVKTDEGVVLLIAGDLSIGEEVFVADESGNMIPADDGTYTSEGKVIVVTAGKISEIKDAEADPIEEVPAEEPVAEEAAEEEAPVEEPAEEPATEEPAEDPAEETEDVEALKARIAELEAENETLKAKIKELEEKTPAAPSIEDEEKEAKKFKQEEKSYKERLLEYAFSKQN